MWQDALAASRWAVLSVEWRSATRLALKLQIEEWPTQHSRFSIVDIMKCLNKLQLVDLTQGVILLRRDPLLRCGTLLR